MDGVVGCGSTINAASGPNLFATPIMLMLYHIKQIGGYDEKKNEPFIYLDCPSFIVLRTTVV